MRQSPNQPYGQPIPSDPMQTPFAPQPLGPPPPKPGKKWWIIIGMVVGLLFALGWGLLAY